MRARFRPQSTHPNRGKVEKKLAGPGFSKITKSYSTKFKDDPDPVRLAPAPFPAAFPERCQLTLSVLLFAVQPGDRGAAATEADDPARGAGPAEGGEVPRGAQEQLPPALRLPLLPVRLARRLPRAVGTCFRLLDLEKSMLRAR